MISILQNIRYLPYNLNTKYYRNRNRAKYVCRNYHIFHPHISLGQKIDVFKDYLVYKSHQPLLIQN